MLLVVMLFGMAAALFVYGMVDTKSHALRRDKDTAAALAEVKRALIGWSAQRTSSNALLNARPGELPCPDINPLDGYEDGTCAPGAIGRVPWKTLGIPEPKDGAGETLWYAIASPFRIWLVNNNPINSDTRGNITVYQDSMASAITTEAVAVLFAPGAALGAQNRDTVATAPCPTTGTTIARNLCAANYLDLETAAGVNNATPNTNTSPPSFISRSAPVSDTFNDRVMVITTADLMPVVEQRVARELRAALAAYYANSGCGCYPPSYTSGCRCYPWADINDGTSQDDLNRGRVPTTALPEAWGSGTIPNLPGWAAPSPPAPGPPGPGTAGWFVNNDWRLVIYYAVGKNFLEANSSGVKGDACNSCVDSTLTVIGDVVPKEVVILMPGPAGVSGAHTNWPFDYFEDAQNNDHSNTNSGNDLYVTPSSTAYARDRLYTIP